MNVLIKYTVKGEPREEEFDLSHLSYRPTPGSIIDRWHTKMQWKKTTKKVELNDGTKRRRTTYVERYKPSEYNLVSVTLSDRPLPYATWKMVHDDFDGVKCPKVKRRMTKTERQLELC